MKKILIVCSLLLAPVALFFLSSSSNNLSELGAQNVEALSWGDNNSIPPYEDMALLWYESSQEQLTCTVNGTLELVPFLNLSDGDFEAGFTYKIVFAGYTCQDRDKATCPPLAQSVNSYTIIDKVKSNTPKK